MRTSTLLAALALVLAAVSPAAAQYFGRNKVQYARFDFAILQTPHFDIYYYESEKDAATIAARLAERWYDRLSHYFDHRFARRQPIILYASHVHFAQTSILDGGIPEGVGGFTDHFAGRVVLPFAASLGETDHVIGHELVHAFQRDILKSRGRSIALLPLWFTEGMAEYVSLGGAQGTAALDAHTRMWLRDADASHRLPTIRQLDDPRYFPYRFGQAFWTFLAREYGDAAVVRALDSRAPGGALGRLYDATGKSDVELTEAWHQSVRLDLGPAPAPTKEAQPQAGRTIVNAANGGQMNVGPALSPDGKWLVFLSERDGYSVDVFLSDTETGRIRRKLLSTAADPHFDSLQFVDSAGAWDASGERFALATIEDGRPVVSIFHMPDCQLIQEVPVPIVDQLFTPAWSPDGGRLVFSAAHGGLTDLYVVELADGRVRALTTDAFSDLQPAWSPDGRTIAFATDRFTSDLDALSFGPYRLGLLDVGSGAIRAAGGLSGAKNIDPRWSVDGTGLFFVSDANGVSNIYRLELATGDVYTVSRVLTGVTGITPSSPALSVSAHDTIAGSVYADGSYQIRMFDARLTGDPVPAAALSAESDPVAHADAPLDAAVRKHAIPAEQAEPVFEHRPYVPRLSLAQLGQPYLSAGGGALGSFIRAGISASFGDMLGQQQLETAVQAGKSITDFAVQLSYLNRRSRWNWGAIVGQVPSLVGASTSTDVGSSPDVINRTEVITQQIHRRASAVAEYPFNHAQRLEFAGGFEAIGLDIQTTRSVFSGTSGDLLDRTVTHGSGAAATLGHVGAALVYDTAIHGMTAPILGQRYRLAIEPSFGDVRFVTSTLDYRRYFMPLNHVTVATRVEQVARFGEGAGDPRLLPLTWTLRDIVRGFATDRDVLLATSFTAANLELRTPLATVLGLRARRNLPIDAIAFSDWARLRARDTAVSSRDLWSAGAGVRVNAAGFIFEFDGVRQMLPVPGWHFVMNFQPGF